MFVGDNRFLETRQLAYQFIADWGDNPSWNVVLQPQSQYSIDWNRAAAKKAEAQKAVDLKRSGQFLESASIYVRMMHAEHRIFEDHLIGMYKAVAAAGDLFYGKHLLLRLRSIYFMEVNRGVLAGWGPERADDHLRQMESAIQHPVALEKYLRSIAGNPDYQLQRPYDESAWEIKGYDWAQATS